jgi:hypothetical protein
MNTLLESALEKIVVITYLKKDGTTRLLRCTRNNSFFNYEFKKTSNSQPKSTHINVWDLEKSAWRTLAYENIKAWNEEIK